MIESVWLIVFKCACCMVFRFAELCWLFAGYLIVWSIGSQRTPKCERALNGLVPGWGDPPGKLLQEASFTPFFRLFLLLSNYLLLILERYMWCTLIISKLLHARVLASTTLSTNRAFLSVICLYVIVGAASFELLYSVSKYNSHLMAFHLWSNS